MASEPMQGVMLSEYGKQASTPSPISRMMASFATDFREQVDINLGVGYVNERTIPHQKIQEALAEVLADPETHRAPMNYGGPQGSGNLIAALKTFLDSTKNGRIDAEVLSRQQMVIGASGATSLLMGIAQVTQPGIVITTDPMYYIFCNILERMGFELVTAPEDAGGIQVEQLQQTLEALGAVRRQSIRFLYVVSVSNPGCSILENARRRALVQIASSLSKELGRKVPLILDKAYEGLIHDPAVEPPESALGYDTEGLVYEIGTLSKILAPALRIGYLIGAQGPFLKALIQNVSDTAFSAPLFTQEISARLLEHHVQAQVAEVNQGYRVKALQVKAWLDEYLGEFLEDCRGGQAGFYFYLTFKEIETGEGSPFFKYLARSSGDETIDGPPRNRNPRVLYIPGTFCVHQAGTMVELGKRQLRVSYGFEELNRIQSALKMMRNACEYVCGL